MSITPRRPPPRKSPNVKRVLAAMAREDEMQRACDAAMKALIDRLRGPRMRKAS